MYGPFPKRSARSAVNAGPHGVLTLQRDFEQRTCRDRFPNGPHGVLTLHDRYSAMRL